MSNDQAVTIIGTVTNVKELKYLPSGSAVLDFGIARNPRKKVNDEWVDGDPHFFNVTAFGSLAENVAASFTKGERVVVFGELDYQTWEKDGEKRNAIKVKAEAVAADLRWATVAITKNAKNDGGGNSGGQQARQAPPEANPFG